MPLSPTPAGTPPVVAAGRGARPLDPVPFPTGIRVAHGIAAEADGDA